MYVLVISWIIGNSNIARYKAKQFENRIHSSLFKHLNDFKMHYPIILVNKNNFADFFNTSECLSLPLFHIIVNITVSEYFTGDPSNYTKSFHPGTTRCIISSSSWAQLCHRWTTHTDTGLPQWCTDLVWTPGAHQAAPSLPSPAG